MLGVKEEGKVGWAVGMAIEIESSGKALQRHRGPATQRAWKWAKPDLVPVLTELSQRGSLAEGGSDPCVQATLGAVQGPQGGLPKELASVSDPEEEAVVA